MSYRGLRFPLTAWKLSPRIVERMLGHTLLKPNGCSDLSSDLDYLTWAKLPWAKLTWAKWRFTVTGPLAATVTFLESVAGQCQMQSAR